jgi:hypothetical protein
VSETLATAVRPGRSREVTPAIALTVLGVVCVVLGGLVAAVTAPLDLTHGSWAAAYLVLVGGVTQYAMGQARRMRPESVQPRAWGWAQVAAWNAGNVVVIVATVAAQPWLVDVGSAVLVAALAVALHAARTASVEAAVPDGPWAPTLVDWGYRVLLVVLLVSVPVGMVLAQLRHG